MSSLRCPSCGGSEKIIGHEVQGLYDGILIWSHPECGWAWVADTHPEGSYRYARGTEYAEEYKAAMKRVREEEQM